MNRSVEWLSIKPTAGEDLIRAYDLYVEAYTRLDDPLVLAVSDRVISAHAPVMLSRSSGVRLHLASTDPGLRQSSLRAVRAYVEQAHRIFPGLRHINMHAAPHHFPDPPVRPGQHPVPRLRPDLARWDLLVEGVRDVARLCGTLGLTLSVENNWAYWDGISPDTPAEECGTQFVEYYATSPEEWLRLPADVGEANCAACLDPSHATPYCHRFPTTQRREVLDRFLADPSRIGHVHWNDSDLYDVRGRGDLHLPVGEGNLDEAFHRRIKAWATHTGRIAHLEHFVSQAALERELAYIERL